MPLSVAWNVTWAVIITVVVFAMLGAFYGWWSKRG